MPQDETQVSSANTEILPENEGILDVEEIIKEENIEENYSIEEQKEPGQSTENVQTVENEAKKPSKTENTTKKTQTTTTTSQTNIPYYIKINYKQNVVTIYAKDEKGNYTKPVKAMVCSCGTATPKSGTYSISSKYKWGKLFGGVSGQYCTRIVNSILFHSVPYITHGDNGSLEYWEYDKLGTTASAGCIRLTVADAKWIYSNCAKGTKVEFYADSNPGPLGKPTAQKISGEEAVRGWDPTDPDAANPWKTYSKEEKPANTVVSGNTITNTTKPENTITSGNTVTNTTKPENTVTSGNTVTNTTKPENTITSGNTVTNTTKPENTVTSGNTVTNTTKPENTITSGNTVTNTTKPGNTVTSGNTVTNTTKPENTITSGNTIKNNNIVNQ